MPFPSAPFDAAQSIFNGLSIIQLKLSPALTGVTAATDTLTKTAHGLINGQGLIYTSGTGFTGLTASTTYYVISAATDTFKLSATVGGVALTPGTSSAGAFQPVLVFEAAKLEDDPEQEIKTLSRPDARGVMRAVRGVRTKGQEKWTFELDEVKRLLPLFSGALIGVKSGTCTLWIPDVDDASGKCALKSENDFACQVSRDGKMGHGGGDFSKATIKIESRKAGDVTWTADATIT